MRIEAHWAGGFVLEGFLFSRHVMDLIVSATIGLSLF